MENRSKLIIHVLEMDNLLKVLAKPSHKTVLMLNLKLNSFKLQTSELNIGLSDLDQTINTQQLAALTTNTYGFFPDNLICQKTFITQSLLIQKRTTSPFKSFKEQFNEYKQIFIIMRIKIDIKSLIFQKQIFFINNCIQLQEQYCFYRNISKDMTNFREQWEFTKIHQDYPDKGEFDNSIVDVEEKVLSYVLNHAQKGNLNSCIHAIDTFCADHWMMNLGPEKGIILKQVFDKAQPKTILQLGGYCGYSSLVFSHLTKATIHTIEISKKYADIASKIQEFAGVADRNIISVGTVSSLKKQIQDKGPYDAIFIDHAKNLYLSDFLLLEQYGVIKKGTIVIGDNIIYPGAPNYLQHLKSKKYYDNTLYHSFVQYSNFPDAVLVSQKLNE